ncbi:MULTISPECIES: MBL fold metallo-hydrolase [Natrialbaceae]|uniref:MBL fold metallo-hydrolase n=1 Tax=Natrialbaceae TaxID=1644061 RepID=UPI00207C761B|nr:MBL fold metallo-hydrolase [Natronococcus sp. CG52]
MQNDAHVHALPLSLEYGGQSLTITPAVVETDRGLVLVDVGPEGAVGGLETHLESLGFSLEDVRLIVLTHHDGDHAGGLSELLTAVDATVATHRDEAPYVAGERDPIKGDDDRYPPVPIDLELVDGVRIPTLAGPMEVVETPGHSPGHISLQFSENRLLLAGDALVADGNESLSGPKPEFTPDMDRATESVGRLAELDVEQTLCYHGGYVEEGADRIAEIHADLRE